MSAGESTLALSVIMVAGGLRRRCERCLDALLGQTILRSLEIVIVDVHQQPTPLRGMEHPAVRYLAAPGSSYADAKVTAIEHARTDTVAFIEEHAVPEPQWAESVAEAFGERNNACVVYTYTNLNPRHAISRAFMLYAYGSWMDPAYSGPVTSGPANNVAYRRSALRCVGGSLARYLDIEYNLHQRLLATGWTMHKAADAVVAHENFVALRPALHDIGIHSQFLASRRAALNEWGCSKRLLYLCGMSVLPALQCWRRGQLLRSSPSLGWAALRHAPILGLFILYAAWREGVGYLDRELDLRRVILDNELMIPRDPSLNVYR